MARTLGIAFIGLFLLVAMSWAWSESCRLMTDSSDGSFLAGLGFAAMSTVIVAYVGRVLWRRLK